MRFTIFIVCALFAVISCTERQSVVDSSVENWISLFNGSDLKDWKVKIRGYDLHDNFGSTFQVIDSLLTVNYAAYDSFENRFGHLFYRDSFSYYKIRTQYRFVGNQATDGPGWAYRNSGIMLHCQSPESMTKSQDFPISIEAQLLGGNGQDERATMNLCTPGTHVYMGDSLFTSHCTTSSSKTYHGDQWVEAEALVLGDSSIVHYVNGEEVLRYFRPQVGGGNVSGHNPDVKYDGKLLQGGFISLQSESHPIQFRKVELLNLCGCMEKRAKNYRSYFVKHDASACIF
jgi:hypothetical protein